MSVIALELEETLATLDSHSAATLERLVRDAIDLASSRESPTAKRATDANGWPIGYFEDTAGSFTAEPLEAPDDPPPTSNASW